MSGRTSYLMCPACGRKKGVGRDFTAGFDRPGDYEACTFPACGCLHCHAAWTTSGTVIHRRNPRLNYRTDPTARAAVVAEIRKEAVRCAGQIVSLQDDIRRHTALADRIEQEVPHA